MNDMRKFLFPAIIFSSTLIIFLTRALYNPDQMVQARSDTPVQLQEVSGEQDDIRNNAPEVENDCSIPSSFPESILQWCQVVEKYAAYYGLEPRLIASVMLQESGGDPRAYSKSGAVGLMQVMPRDGLAADFICINGPCFSSRPSMEQLFDPDFNIDFGVGLLSGLISRYGDVREGLRAYGPMDRGYYYADLVLEIYNNYQ